MNYSRSRDKLAGKRIISDNSEHRLKKAYMYKCYKDEVGDGGEFMLTCTCERSA